MNAPSTDTTLQYVAYVRKEGRHYLIEFPGAPGCQTFADSQKNVYATAKEAIEGWLEAHILEEMDLPQTHRPPAANERSIPIIISPKLALVLQLRAMRRESGWSQAQLAKRVGVSQQQIAKLEDPDANPTLETIMKIADAFNMSLLLAFRKIA